MHSKTTQLHDRLLLVTLLGVTGLYTMGFFSWYGGTVLGLAPVLDGKENLLLAHAMAEGATPAEPFYRAPLYPFILSLFLKFGLATDWLPLAARLLNGACHLLTTGLVFSIARQLWQSRAAATLCGLLVGLNPVLLHFAADPLDITLGITWLVLALWQAIRTLDKASLHSACLSSAFLILGVYTRPHLLPVAIVWPLFLVFVNRRQALVAAATVAAGVLLFGVLNLERSGSFAALPTQGAYNLWTANKPGANGRYYVQTLDISSAQTDYTNPARLEAELLYERETGHSAALDRNAANRYWRHKALAQIASQPLDWLGLMAHKSYALLNNYEQYNNKTYTFHKARSPWLRWNPLGWVVVLSLGVFGALRFIKKPVVGLIALWIIAYAIGVLLFYASARFRVSLVPLFALLAGGAWVSVTRGNNNRGLQHWATLTITITLVGVSLTHFFNIHDNATIAEDNLLLAHAASELKQDAVSRDWAEEALKRKPDSLAAKEIAVLAQFNLWLRGEEPPPQRNELTAALRQAEEVNTVSDQANWITGVYLFKLGQSTEAFSIWQSQWDDAKSPDDALAMLMLVGYLDVQISSERMSNGSPLLQTTVQYQLNPDALDAAQLRSLQFLMTPAKDSF